MSVYTTYTDQELLYLITQGDEAAFNEVYVRYWKMLMAAAYSRLNHPEDAREIVQEVFFILWKHRKQLHILHLSGYLSAVTRHAVYRFIAAKGRNGNPLPDNTNAAEEMNTSHWQLNRLLAKFANTLPPAQRSLFIECKLRDQPLKEVAAALGIPQRTAEGYILRTLRLLRKQFPNHRFLVFSWICSLAFA